MSLLTSNMPDWRSAESYRPLLDADLATWAWEFGRRAQGLVYDPEGVCFAAPGPGADPHPAVIWRADVDPAVPTLTASPAEAGDAGALDILDLKLPVAVVRCEQGSQHVLVCDGERRLRFSIVQGDVLVGPVALAFPFPARTAGVASLESLRALIHLRDTGRLPVGGRGPGRATRWIATLRAHDARRDGASQREIAVMLFGEGRVAADWAGASDYMRMRVQRLIRAAEAMVSGGYRAVCGLSSPNGDADRPVETWLSRWTTAWRPNNSGGLG